MATMMTVDTKETQDYLAKVLAAANEFNGGSLTNTLLVIDTKPVKFVDALTILTGQTTDNETSSIDKDILTAVIKKLEETEKRLKAHREILKINEVVREGGLIMMKSNVAAGMARVAQAKMQAQGTSASAAASNSPPPLPPNKELAQQHMKDTARVMQELTRGKRMLERDISKERTAKNPTQETHYVRLPTPGQLADPLEKQEVELNEPTEPPSSAAQAASDNTYTRMPNVPNRPPASAVPLPTVSTPEPVSAPSARVAPPLPASPPPNAAALKRETSAVTGASPPPLPTSPPPTNEKKRHAIPDELKNIATAAAPPTQSRKK